MKVITNNTNGGSLCYLFKLQDGLGEGQSYAIDCAKESGLPETIINKGKQTNKTKNDPKTVLAKEFLKALSNGATPEDLRLADTSEQKLQEATNLIKQYKR